LRRALLLGLALVALAAAPAPLLAQPPDPVAALLGVGVLAPDGGVPLDGLVVFPDGGYEARWPDGGADVPLWVVEGERCPMSGLELSPLTARIKAAELVVCHQTVAQQSAALLAVAAAPQPAPEPGLSLGAKVGIGAGAVAVVVGAVVVGYEVGTHRSTP
jgi:hypothetical protein